MYLFNRYNCWVELQPDRFNPVQVVPKGFPFQSDLVTGGDLSSLAIPFQERDTERCQPVRYKYFAPRFGLAWRLFGSNRTVLRVGAGLSYDQDVGESEGGARLYRSFLGQGRRNPRSEGRRPVSYTGSSGPCPWRRPAPNTSPTTSTTRIGRKGRSTATTFPCSTKSSGARSWRWPTWVTRLATCVTGALGTSPMPEGFTVTVPYTEQRVVVSGDQRARRPIPNVRPNIMTHSDGATDYNSLQGQVGAAISGRDLPVYGLHLVPNDGSQLPRDLVRRCNLERVRP